MLWIFNWLFTVSNKILACIYDLQKDIHEIQCPGLNIHFNIQESGLSISSLVRYPSSTFRNLVRYLPQYSGVCSCLLRYPNSTFRNLVRYLWAPIRASPPRAWKSGLHHAHLLQAYLRYCQCTGAATVQVQASVFNHVRPVTAASTCEPLVSQVAKNGGGLRSFLETPTRAVRGLDVITVWVLHVSLHHTISVERCLRLCPHRRLWQ